MVEIDETDRPVLAALLADGRASASDVSTAAGVAPATATRRREGLEDAGVIEGYRAVVDYEAFGYSVTAVFELDVDGGGRQSVVADLRAADRLTDVYVVTGEYDVIAVGRFTDTDELNERIKRLLTHRHVRTLQTNVVLDTVCEHEPLPVHDADSPASSAGSPRAADTD